MLRSLLAKGFVLATITFTALLLAAFCALTTLDFPRPLDVAPSMESRRHVVTDLVVCPSVPEDAPARTLARVPGHSLPRQGQ